MDVFGRSHVDQVRTDLNSSLDHVNVGIACCKLVQGPRDCLQGGTLSLHNCKSLEAEHTTILKEGADKGTPCKQYCN